MLASDNEEFELARDMIKYHILQACGAGTAAMGGLDTIVFSGRFAALGETLGPWLTSSLPLRGQPEGNQVAWECCWEALDRAMADNASAAVLEIRADTSRAGPWRRQTCHQ